MDEDGRHWKFEGQIFDDQPEGGGQMTWDNGDSYEGDFHVGLRHGNGVFTFKNGTIYKGTLGAFQIISDIQRGEGLQHSATQTLFTFRNTVFRAFGSEKFCVTAKRGS